MDTDLSNGGQVRWSTRIQFVVSITLLDLFNHSYEHHIFRK